MNNKGFTVIELIVSFCLAVTVAFLLFQILTGFKELYIKGNIETTFETKRSNMLKLINNDLNQKGLSAVARCEENSDNCIKFTFLDSTEGILSVGDGIIKYNNYTIKPIEGSTIGDLVVNNESFDFKVDDILINKFSILSVNIPLKNKLSDKNFDIKFIYQYDINDNISISL